MADTHHTGPRRYRRYTPGPDPLAPPPDLTKALGAIGEDVMAGYSPAQALREYLRRAGYDRLSSRVQQRRQEMLTRHNLTGTLTEVKKLLDDAVLAERGQLARDVMMDDEDRAFRELQMQNLPDSTAAAVRELSEYDWQSGDAREKFERIKDLLGREFLDQRFAGMKQALEGATDEDRQAIAEMLGDLNDLLGKHARGQATVQDFQDFMAKHGEQFPENPENIDELIDALAKRSAAAQRMLNSMSAEQRRELMELSAQAFGSQELINQLGMLDANLRSIRPDLDWHGSEDFSGQQGMGLGDATGAMQDLAELDALSDQLADARGSDLDIDSLARQLGEDAAVDARTLAELEKALRDSGMLQRGDDGQYRLSPAAMRKLGKSLLDDAAAALSRDAGAHDSRHTGALGELTGASRPWEFGDTQTWDVTRTITNALQRTAGTEEGLRITPEDIEVAETEARTRQAVVLLVDTSFSMAAEGRWVPMKRTALALHHLVSTKFRGDELALISFGRLAMNLGIEELTALPPVQEQGTNLHHGLLLAERFFARHAGLDPVLLVVTDGEPTAHLEDWGEAWFTWPTTPETLRRTVAQLDRIARRGTRATFFQLGDDPGLTHFLEQLSARVQGRLVIPDLEELGASVIGEYLRGRE